VTADRKKNLIAYISRRACTLPHTAAAMSAAGVVAQLAASMTKVPGWR